MVEIHRRPDQPNSDAERINKRLRNSGSPEADVVVKTGDSARRTFHNLHYKGQNQSHGKPNGGER